MALFSSWPALPSNECWGGGSYHPGPPNFGCYFDPHHQILAICQDLAVHPDLAVRQDLTVHQDLAIRQDLAVRRVLAVRHSMKADCSQSSMF